MDRAQTGLPRSVPSGGSAGKTQKSVGDPKGWSQNHLEGHSLTGLTPAQGHPKAGLSWAAHEGLPTTGCPHTPMWACISQRSSWCFPEAEDEAAQPQNHGCHLGLRIWSLRQPRAKGKEFESFSFFFFFFFGGFQFHSLEHIIIFTHFTFFFFNILFKIFFHYSLSYDSEHSSQCYTVGPCCLSILYLIVCIC